MTSNLLLQLCALLLWGSLLFCPPVAAAEQPTQLLFFPEQEITVGDQIIVSVYSHNETLSTLWFDPPSSLFFELSTDSGTNRLVQAHSVNPTQARHLLPEQFQRQDYQLSLPRDLSTSVKVRFAETTTPTAVIEVLPVLDSVTDLDSSSADNNTFHSYKDLESLYQSYVADLFTYEPIYFLVGTDPSKSKFQLSFKYRLLNRSGSLSNKYPWLSGLYLAYTQTSYWDLDAKSIPFSDTSYKPQLMFQTGNLSRMNKVAGFFLRAGLMHESNGRSGETSRSTNYAYIKPMAIFYHPGSQLGLMISPKLLTYINNDNDNNPDLADYRGYFELETRIGKAHSLLWTTNLRFARKGTSFTTDMTYPIDRLIGNNLNIYFQIQYTNALAESLINYRERTESVRLGIAIFR